MTNPTPNSLDPISDDKATGNRYADNQGLSRLNEVLRAVAFKEQIALALGIQETTTQPEEFWTEQRRAARQRFFLLCLQRMGLDLGTYRETLDSAQAHLVADEAEHLLDHEALTYTLVRQWFLNRGQFDYSAAVIRRQERAKLHGLALRVLVLLEAGGAKYLAYGPGMTDVRLVDKREDAYQFPVLSPSELDKAHLEAMASHFETVRKHFEGKKVKILASARS